MVYDVSNACLGVLNGMVNVANAIELGQIRAGMVVACESAREIVDLTIDRLLRERSMDTLRKTVATLTGGSGAVAVVLTDGSFAPQARRLLGGVARSAPEHHRLCVWGPDTGIPGGTSHMAETDSTQVLQHGVALGIETLHEFRRALALAADQPDQVICHQVGAAHRAPSWRRSGSRRSRTSRPSATSATSARCPCRSPPPSPTNARSCARATASACSASAAG